ncbi:MAG: D-mannonate epimerase [Planctomycetota bacterium]|nr:D-mannonate epimerase [Planctomycetota bacterium]
MPTYFAKGSLETEIDSIELKEVVDSVFSQFGSKKNVLVIPPDFTRFPSRAGEITCLLHQHYKENLVDVMPALGTHFAMPDWQLDKMFPGLPKQLIRVHDWRNDVVTIGEVPANFVADCTDGIWNKPWKAQLNQLVWSGKHDLIVSVGQVVPHEVIGMANYNKNLFVGTGGVDGINESHFISAAYGMERVMGRADTPLRQILNYAQDKFCQELPLIYVLTVIGKNAKGKNVIRGLFIGSDHDCFSQAAALSQQVNVNILNERPDRVVAWLDPEEFHSTWIGNKSIYRTRMLIADGGELIVLAKGVKTFGEDPEIDRLIRKYGYRTTPEVLSLVNNQDDLRQNLSAAAHLIHGSSENRFKITYATEDLAKEAIEAVGYQHLDYAEAVQTYDVKTLQEGWNEDRQGRFYCVQNPALGLWAHRSAI